MDPRWKHPFTCIVAGPTGCGKTTFVARLLRNASTMIDPSPERVTWYYREWHSAYENLDIPNLHLEEGLPPSFGVGKRNIVVLDDLMAETDDRVTNLFTKKSHHCNTSVIYLVQNLFSKNKESRTISLNTQYIVVFKNPRDVSKMTTLAKQMYPGRVKYFQEAFADATSTPYGYILVDLKQDTPEDHVHATRRCCSVCIHAKSINSREHCVTPHFTMSLRMTCLYRYNAELRKTQSLKAVIVGELCEAAYDNLEAAARLTYRQRQSMRIYTAQLLSLIKRVTSECYHQSRIVWLCEETSGLISRQCRHLLKGELKMRCCLDVILVCRLCLAAYELLERTIPLSRGQQRYMRRFTLNMRSCIKRVTRWDNSQSCDVWSHEETSSLSSDAQQDDEYKASKGHTRTRRR